MGYYEHFKDIPHCNTIFNNHEFLSFSNHHILKANLVFEMVTLVTIFILLISLEIRKPKALLSFILFSYLLIKAFINIAFNEINIVDFIISHKFIVYLILGLMISDIKTSGWDSFGGLFKILLFGFFIKYLVSVLTGLNYRPSLFAENNFELMFLLIASITKHENINKLTTIELIIILCVFLLSGSRSGLVCLLFVFTIYNIKDLSIKSIMNLFALLILSTIVGFIFLSRMSSFNLESIDRFVFMQGFIDASEHKTILEHLFGSVVIEKIPQNVCSSFSYYSILFSHGDDGISCYSNIFHSFVLRCIYDFGVFGLIFSFYVLWNTINDKATIRGVISVIGVITLNGFSVSSLNSVYCTMGILFLILTSGSKNNGTI